MKSALGLSAATGLLLVAVPAFAQDSAQAAPTGPEIIRASDAQMSCMQISDEAAELSARMGAEPHGGLFGRIGGVAKAGAAMLIPGAGLAMAAADVATAEDRERRAAETLATQHRWYYLNGLYAGQRCMAQASEASSTAPAPQIQPVSSTSD